MGTVVASPPTEKGPAVTRAPAAPQTPQSPAEAIKARLTSPFSGPWRDGTPVFGCCRKTVTAAAEGVDPVALLALDVSARVQALREAVDAELPGHLASHRCCIGHIADLAFDLPDLLAEDHEATAPTV